MWALQKKNAIEKFESFFVDLILETKGKQVSLTMFANVIETLKLDMSIIEEEILLARRLWFYVQSQESCHKGGKTWRYDLKTRKYFKKKTFTNVNIIQNTLT